MSFADLRLTAAGARKGSLILVNREHPLQGELIPDLVPLEGGWPDQHLDRTAARMLAAAIEAVQGRGQILPVSGWRNAWDFPEWFWQENSAAERLKKSFTPHRWKLKYLSTVRTVCRYPVSVI